MNLQETVPDSGNVATHIDGLNGTHAIGLVCSDEAWKAISPLQGSIEVIGSKTDANVISSEMGRAGTFCDKIPSCHYIGSVSGHGSAELTIKFSNAATRSIGGVANLVVTKSPEQTVW